MTTKIICNFVLPGSVMLPPSECENPENPSKSKDFTHKSIKIFNKKKERVEYIDYYVRNTIDARQTLNISDIAYDWMSSADSYVDANTLKSEWKKMSVYARIDRHVELIAKSLHAKSYSFDILPD